MRDGSCAVSFCLLLLGGCSLLFSEAKPATSDSDASASVDAQVQLIDAGLSDSGPTDGSVVDASFIARCAPGLSGTIGLFSIDGDQDGSEMKNALSGSANGEYLTQGLLDADAGGLGTPTIVSGVCGQALRLGGSIPPGIPRASFAVLPANAFEDALSVDFWFRLPSMPQNAQKVEGLVTKNSAINTQGDFGVFISRLGANPRLVVRTVYGNVQIAQSCSTSLDPDVDHHVAVSFAGTRVTAYLNGVLINTGISGGSAGDGLSESACSSTLAGSASESTPAENGNDWVFGSGMLPQTPRSLLYTGLLDELRFRSVEFTQTEALDVYTARSSQ